MNKKNIISYLILFFMSLLYFVLLLDKDVLFEAHDLDFHISNIYVISKQISFSNLLPNKILPVLANGLGYGVNIFYPIFPHLVGAYLFKIIGDISCTMKILSLIIINLSGITMYNYIYKVFKDRKAALFSSACYISMPYLFTDIFIRGAFNESFLLFIVPLIFLGIHYLIDDNNKLMFYLLFVIGYVLAINTHLVLSIYLTVVILIYLLILRKKVFKKEIIKEFILSSVFILLLTLNFTVPLLEHYNLGIYNIFNIEYTLDKSVFTLELVRFFIPVKHWDMYFYIPPLVLLGLIIMLLKLKSLNKDNKRIVIGMFSIIVFSMFLSSNQDIWNIIPNIFRNIQFGWRMTLFITFAVSVILGRFLLLFKNKVKKIVLGIFILVFSIQIIYYSNNYTKEIEFLESEYIHSGLDKKWALEYLPMNCIKDLIYIKNKSDGFEFNSDKIELKIKKNQVPNMSFEVLNLEDEIEIEFPRIYYLGYDLIDADGKKYKTFQNENGLIGANIIKDGKYKLEYNGTLIDRICYFIVIISYIGFIIYLIKLKKEGKTNGNK